MSTLSGLVGGAAAHAEGHARLGDMLWAAGALIALALVGSRILVDVLKKRAGVDVIALLAIGGALLLREYLAGALIGAMMATGSARRVRRRARAARALRPPRARPPRRAPPRGADVTTVPIGAVTPGDLLLVKAGEIVPVDGVVVGPQALLDESALTGEPRPVEKAPGDRVDSGTTNAGARSSSAPSRARTRARTPASSASSLSLSLSLFSLLCSRRPPRKAPLARLADRHALAFAALSLAMAAAAWGLSGDAGRGLAVLVVATPCPLLLAVPIAIVGGISRSARRGIVVKGGAALEALARAEILLLDKTGTLTFGGPRVTGVTCFRSIEDDTEVLRLGGVPRADLVTPALRGPGARCPRASPRAVLPGGRSGGGRRRHDGPGGRARRPRGERRMGSAGRAASGGRPRLPAPRVPRRCDDRLRGRGQQRHRRADARRPDPPRCAADLAGIAAGRHSPCRDGDGRPPLVAETVGATLGVDRVLAQRSPEEKVAAVREARAEGLTVMIGDGINDAPALAAADVGVAMGARGATSSAEAADVVLVVDRLDRFAEAVTIARRARAIAAQSAILGMGLSLFAMGAAAFGFLPAAAGAPCRRRSTSPRS